MYIAIPGNGFTQNITCSSFRIKMEEFFMNTILSKELYNNYYKYMSSKLIAGKDRVNKKTYEKFFHENYNIIVSKMKNCTYKFTNFKEVDKNGRAVYIPTIRDRIVLEHLKNCLIRKYKIHLRSRENIIEEIRELCQENIDYYIIRTDISSFFKNINQDILKKKLFRSSLLNSIQMHLIMNLLNKVENGVPQGIGLSNYLSELYLENFDFEIKGINTRIFYYSRYVDDIIIIIPGKVTEREKIEIDSKIDGIFKKYELILNEKKTEKIDFAKADSPIFDYLGYSFQRKARKLNMQIANYKMIILKEKIDKLFDDYEANLNYHLLYERLKVFTSVNKINKVKAYFNSDEELYFRSYNVFYGINIDYHYAGAESIDKLNGYIKYKLHKISTIARNDKRKLYSLMISYINGNRDYRLLVYDKISLLELRNIVHKINPKLPWKKIISLNKHDLLQQYFKCINLE